MTSSRTDPPTEGAVTTSIGAAETVPAAVGTPHDGQLDDALAGARPADPAGLALARARVGGALFGTTAALGRFHVLEQLGKGGMGVVYAAYDPELDRKVALKTVNVPEGGRDIAVAEAKALAKLSHPNVVPVFDVGVVEGQVYIVMELVRGATLREWVKDRRPREILDAYREAALGLASAHASGLVHRDFKPDNAIVGSDGRVRVVDFGLACEATAPDGAPRRTAGTPRYMAPEQAGGVVTPAADQYSFCVSLAEALGREGGAPLPRWIEAIVQRGRAPDPAQRFASMPDLLRALGRDPARIWRRRAIVAGLAVATVAAFFVGRSRTGAEAEVCGGGERELAVSWDPAARDQQLARIAAASTYGRELAPQVAADVARYRTRWASGYQVACLTQRRGLQSEAMLDRRMTCLERGRSALAAVAEIASTADAKALPEIARAVAALPDPDACADLTTLAADVPPPAPALAAQLVPLRKELERARVQLTAGRSTSARTIAHDTTAQLRTIGYPPLLAEGLLIEGDALRGTDPEGAIAVLREATSTAFAGHVDAVAIEAWARRAWLEGTNDRPQALAGLDVIEALARRTPSATFARALLLNNVGGVELAQGHRAEARAWFERALEASHTASGPGAVELAAIPRNLALITDDLGRREKLLADAGATLARLLGPSHPETLTTEFVRTATAIVDLQATNEALSTICKQLELHERLAEEVPNCLGELGYVRAELGDLEGARAAYARALELDAAANVPELAGYLLLWRGDAAGAARTFEAAITASPMEPGQASYKNYVYAKLQLGRGRALRTLGRLDDARRALERSLDTLDKTDNRLTVQRRLGRARAETAAVLAAAHAPLDEIRDRAAHALAWYRPAGGAPSLIAELERLAGSP
ncbi:MAG TPA: protein kinase [Kofleriaceae bacterium]|nr:protein kinase [Kofleriaceae bacterium]